MKARINRTTKYLALIKAAILISVAASFGTKTLADTINGTIEATPVSVDLNLSSAYAYYGISGSFTPATDPSDIGGFSTLTANGEFTGTGNDAVYNLMTYNNGSSSATPSPNYSLAQIRAFDTGVANLSMSTTLFAPSENVSVYVFGYDTAPDFSATLGSASFSLNNVILPTTADGSGTGDGHTYGILDLTVTGAIGETMTIETFTDRTGVVGGNGYTTVGISGATADAVPEPGVRAILMCGFGLCTILQRRLVIRTRVGR
jgi:hypothetical protein